tara:strand:- start:111 stop:401 length:291 start_codon:yes stop_codon:yes gene_type:complete
MKIMERGWDAPHEFCGYLARVVVLVGRLKISNVNSADAAGSVKGVLSGVMSNITSTEALVNKSSRHAFLEKFSKFIGVQEKKMTLLFFFSKKSTTY